MSSTVAYALACVLVPFGWGVLMFYAFGWWQARLRRRASQAGPPPIDYSI